MNPLTRISLRLSLPLALLCFTVLLSVVVLARGYHASQERSQLAHTEAMRSQLTTLRAVIDEQMEIRNLAGVQRHISYASALGDVHAILFLDAGGKVLSASHMAWNNTPLSHLADALPGAVITAIQECLDAPEQRTEMEMRVLGDAHHLVGLLPLEWAYADDIAANVPFRHTGLLVILHDLTYTSDVAFHAVLQDIMPVFLLLAVAMAGLGLLLHVTMTRRVNRLIASVRLFSGGDYQARACVSGQDEIALIGDAFDAMADRITSVQDNLEHQIMERTIQLENSLAALQQTQESVLQTEKMGALGRLVMEIAHEINTPLGIAITTSTLIRDQFDDMAGAFRNNQLKRAHLADYVTVMANTLTILVANLNRTAALVREFKQMTLQQSAAEGYRQFALCPYLREVLHTLTPMLYPHHHRATVNCSENIFMRGFPEILARILTNLVVNSLEHGFADGRRGTITITALRRQDRVILEYRDNGVGLSATARGRIFEPFYTTKKENGHIGLGLTVVYNLVTQVYCGKIQCTGDSTTGLETGLETELETGLGIILDLPLALPIPEGAIVTQYMPP